MEEWLNWLYDNLMKIAFIGQKGIPAKLGGVERHVEELAVRLAQRGNEVFVYVRNNYTDDNIREYKGVTLIHLPSISSKHLDAITHTFLGTIHALFQSYDIIHYQAIGPTSLSWIVKLFRPGVALVATYHCMDYFHKKWGRIARAYLRFGEYMACNIPDKTVAVSHTLGQFVWEKFGRKCPVIPNGFSVMPSSDAHELYRWQIRRKEYILCVSRLIEHKGIHYLIEAYNHLEDRGKTGGKKLVIAGEGFYTDDYVKYLKALAKGRKNIIFTGPQTGNILRQLFSHAYLFVQPSESEGLSIALLEAMGCGKAVLASDIPENKEAMGNTGVCFHSGDKNDLAKKLDLLIRNEDKVRKMGIKAWRRANEKYSWEKITRNTEGMYKSMLRTSKPSAVMAHEI